LREVATVKAEASHPEIPAAGVVEVAARYAVRRFRVPHEDFEDLRSSLWVKLLDRDAYVIKAFAGRSTLGTYLHRVAERLASDQRTARLGRWRPSALARRLGPVAVAWLRFVERDGLAPDEATVLVERRMHVDAADRAAIAQLQRAKRRHVGRRYVSLDSVVPREVTRTDRVAPQDYELAQREARQRVRCALRQAIARLSPEERRLVSLRFRSGLRLAEIAVSDGRVPMSLYRQFTRILGTLRATMDGCGVEAETVALALEVRGAWMGGFDCHRDDRNGTGE
jgi:RNA polymerase sigma factor (sigma-70 family)